MTGAEQARAFIEREGLTHHVEQVVDTAPPLPASAEAVWRAAVTTALRGRPPRQGVSRETA